jgi:CYTH domain-containing protein
VQFQRAPGEGRYAHIEREQRWRLPARPAGLVAPTEIVDRYLVGTRLRLRQMTSADGTIYKLGQKVRPDEASPAVVKLTNMYLSPAEYGVLAALPHHELRKTRWRLGPGSRVVVDEFHGACEGLVLAEVELSADEPPPAGPVPDAVDVTLDDRFSGGSLARTGLVHIGPF